MTVREQWEIKWILWINVQENWTTQVLTDTINIVWWWTVTDTWWVATINIPQWCTWYREDVSAGSASYTFVHEPATSTSFLVFTDSGTLLFSGIDYTYDPDTHTITFLSLWATEKAYIWIAHATVMWGWIWDMVKSVYDPTNINASAFDYNNFINTPTIWAATLSITKNSTPVASFSANATTNVTADITVPTTVAELTDASDYVTTTDLGTTLAWYVQTSALSSYVEWPASATNNNIAVFDWATGKLIKDSWLNIQTTNTVPVWASICDVYYNNGTIYLYTNAVRDNIILES